MKDRHLPPGSSQPPRRDMMFEKRVHDPYLVAAKWQEPSVCPDCSAVYHRGRWQWGEVSPDAHVHRCPACARIHDQVPAGVLSLSGEFFTEHKEEILHLIRNLEVKEKGEHPLERIMGIDEEGDGTTIRYTGMHLTQGTGEALHHAYHGDLDVVFNDSDGQIRVRWSR